MIFRKKKYAAGQSLSKLAWRKFFRDKLAMTAFAVILLTLGVAILGYLISPDPTPYANNQILEIATQKPGFEVEMLKIRKNVPTIKTNWFQWILFGKKSNYSLVPIRAYEIDGALIRCEIYNPVEDEKGDTVTFHLADVVYPLSSETSPEPDQQSRLIFHDLDGQTVSIKLSDLQEEVKKNNLFRKTYILGTDRFGRDLLSQIMIGTRVSLSVGFISVFISLLIGIVIGSLGGFFRGWIDQLVMWFINVVWSIPTILLVIAITFALGKGFWQVFIAVGLTMWVEVARVIRGQILSIREKEFVEAARALGFGSLRTIYRHILPNVLGPVIVISAANFASAIIMEAGLSFLGIGVQPPMPSWGMMIRENYGYIMLDAAYMAIFPGLAIMILVLAFMLIGNALRDALDVKEVN